MATTNSFMAAVTLAAAIVTTAGYAQADPRYMATGGATTQPVGHYEFCRANPGECAATGSRVRPVELTRQLWAEMIDVNNMVNTMVRPLTDAEIWGVEERWSYPTNGVGDCEDYALEKRRKLVEIGVPAGNLLVTVVRQPNGDGHAVLTARTSLGDFILDNIEPRILAWNETEYQYLKHQSVSDAGAWSSVDDSRQIVVGSVNQGR